MGCWPHWVTRSLCLVRRRCCSTEFLSRATVTERAPTQRRDKGLRILRFVFLSPRVDIVSLEGLRRTVRSWTATTATRKGQQRRVQETEEVNAGEETSPQDMLGHTPRR